MVLVLVELSESSALRRTLDTSDTSQGASSMVWLNRRGPLAQWKLLSEAIAGNPGFAWALTVAAVGETRNLVLVPVRNGRNHPPVQPHKRHLHVSALLPHCEQMVAGQERQKYTQQDAIGGLSFVALHSTGAMECGERKTVSESCLRASMRIYCVMCKAVCVMGCSVRRHVGCG